LEKTPNLLSDDYWSHGHFICGNCHAAKTLSETRTIVPEGSRHSNVKESDALKGRAITREEESPGDQHFKKTWPLRKEFGEMFSDEDNNVIDNRFLLRLKESLKKNFFEGREGVAGAGWGCPDNLLFSGRDKEKSLAKGSCIYSLIGFIK